LVAHPPEIAFNTYAGVYIVNADSGAFYDPIQGSGQLEDFAWSADGAYLTALFYPLGGTHSDLITVTRDNGHRYLYDSPLGVYLMSEVWNPQSTSLAFNARNLPTQSDIDLLTITK
jgi:hypothetical protein